MTYLKFRCDPVSSYWTFEIRVSLGVHFVDHSFSGFWGRVTCLFKRASRKQKTGISSESEVGRSAWGRKSETLETSEEDLSISVAGEHWQSCGSLWRDRDAAPSQGCSLQAALIPDEWSYICQLMLAATCLLRRARTARKCPNFTTLIFIKMICFSLYPTPTVAPHGHPISLVVWNSLPEGCTLPN